MSPPKSNIEFFLKHYSQFLLFCQAERVYVCVCVCGHACARVSPCVATQISNIVMLLSAFSYFKHIETGIEDQQQRIFMSMSHKYWPQIF